MSAIIGKRKREVISVPSKKVKKASFSTQVNGKEKSLSNGKPSKPATKDLEKPREISTTSLKTKSDHSDHIIIQIVTGSYERVLHGIAARVPLLDTTQDASTDVTFTDTFLFAAHASSIRCLAISPAAESTKRILATGSSDERINLYSISTVAPSPSGHPSTLPSLLITTPTAPNPRNKPVGTLMHHDRAITSLAFPTKTKLFSAAEDNTIAISRTRDWTMLSAIKAPIPKPQGRPSGDTAGPGELPSGINAFAIHPSQKLMLSVGRRERCMRLWNLMTGKKAGVLTFDRELLAQVGEGKHGLGEGCRVLWNPAGEAYVVGFERGAAVFGIDSRPKAVIKPTPMTKFHQMHFLPLFSEGSGGDSKADILAISTEDGRVLFYDVSTTTSEADPTALPQCTCLGQLGGSATGISGRIKDFETFALPHDSKTATQLLMVTGSSDGAVRIWTVSKDECARFIEKCSKSPEGAKTNGSLTETTAQVGSLTGTLNTGDRITCLGGFVMDGEESGEKREDEHVDEDEDDGESGSDEDEESE